MSNNFVFACRYFDPSIMSVNNWGFSTMETDVPLQRRLLGFIGILRSDKFIKALSNLPENLLLLSEEELVVTAKPTKADWMIRMRLWKLVAGIESSFPNEQKISNRMLFEGVVREKSFYQKLDLPEKVAFYSLPCGDISDEFDVFVAYSQHKMWQLLSKIEVVLPSGEIDHKAANLLLKLFNSLSRVSATKKSIGHSRKEESCSINHHDLDELDSQIASLITMGR